MLFMVIERFRKRGALAVSDRLRDKSHIVREGLRNVGRWVEVGQGRGFQLIECDDAQLFQQWVLEWQDLIEFEIVPVVECKDRIEIVGHVDVRMPQVGESIEQGTVARWLKRIGDSVKLDEPLLEIATDKVDMEIPSPCNGTLAEILISAGETVSTGTVVARIKYS